MNTDVRGSVKIKSANPDVYPEIKFNYLSTKQERKEWIEAIHCSQLIEQSAFDEPEEKSLRVNTFKATRKSSILLPRGERLSSQLYV